MSSSSSSLALSPPNAKYLSHSASSTSTSSTSFKFGTDFGLTSSFDGSSSSSSTFIFSVVADGGCFDASSDFLVVAPFDLWPSFPSLSSSSLFLSFLLLLSLLLLPFFSSSTNSPSDAAAFFCSSKDSMDCFLRFSAISFCACWSVSCAFRRASEYTFSASSTSDFNRANSLSEYSTSLTICALRSFVCSISLSISSVNRAMLPEEAAPPSLLFWPLPEVVAKWCASSSSSISNVTCPKCAPTISCSSSSKLLMFEFKSPPLPIWLTSDIPAAHAAATRFLGGAFDGACNALAFASGVPAFFRASAKSFIFFFCCLKACFFGGNAGEIDRPIPSPPLLKWSRFVLASIIFLASAPSAPLPNLPPFVSLLLFPFGPFWNVSIKSLLFVPFLKPEALVFPFFFAMLPPWSAAFRFLLALAVFPLDPPLFGAFVVSTFPFAAAAAFCFARTVALYGADSISPRRKCWNLIRFLHLSFSCTPVLPLEF